MISRLRAAQLLTLGLAFSLQPQIADACGPDDPYNDWTCDHTDDQYFDYGDYGWWSNSSGAYGWWQADGSAGYGNGAGDSYYVNGYGDGFAEYYGGNWLTWTAAGDETVCGPTGGCSPLFTANPAVAQTPVTTGESAVTLVAIKVGQALGAIGLDAFHSAMLRMGNAPAWLRPFYTMFGSVITGANSVANWTKYGGDVLLSFAKASGKTLAELVAVPFQTIIFLLDYQVLLDPGDCQDASCDPNSGGIPGNPPPPPPPEVGCNGDVNASYDANGTCCWPSERGCDNFCFTAPCP